MWWTRLFTISIVLLGIIVTAPKSEADIIHRIRLSVKPIIVVWGNEPPAETLSVLQASKRLGSRRRIRVAPRALVTTGNLLPLGTIVPHNAVSADTTIPFFHVASNAPFQIDAQLAEPSNIVQRDLARQYLNLFVELSSESGPKFGSNAQWPHSGGPGSGFPQVSIDLATLKRPTTVFTGNQKTAARRGTVAEQSVRFNVFVSDENAGSLNGAQNPEIIFTVYSL